MKLRLPNAELQALFRRNPSFAKLLAADLVCQFGDGGLLIAFPMLILEQTQDVSLTGLSLSAEILAAAILSPFAGVVADKLRQKPVMIAANVLKILLLTILLLVLQAGGSVMALLGLSLAIGAAGSFFMPARAAFMRRMLTGEDLQKAIALEGTLSFLIRIVSQPLVGLLLTFAPATVGVQVDMAAYLLATLMLASRQVRAEFEVEEKVISGRWDEGWRTIARTGSLRGLLVLDVLLCLIGMAAFTLTIALLDRELKLGPQANSLLLATTGVAGAIGTRLAGRFGQSRKAYALLTGVIATSYLCVGLAHSMALLMLIWSWRGLAIGALGVMINQRLASETPIEVMGRVNAAWSLAVSLAAFAGTASAPLLIRTIGPASAYTLLGSMLAVLAVSLAARGWRSRVIITRRELVS